MGSAERSGKDRQVARPFDHASIRHIYVLSVVVCEVVNRERYGFAAVSELASIFHIALVFIVSTSWLRDHRQNLFVNVEPLLSKRMATPFLLS
jgi:hypothetical protein